MTPKFWFKPQLFKFVFYKAISHCCELESNRALFGKAGALLGNITLVTIIVMISVNVKELFKKANEKRKEKKLEKAIQEEYEASQKVEEELYSDDTVQEDFEDLLTEEKPVLLIIST